MSGVRVFGLPGNATEKDLRVYFSQESNGGGSVKQILHPLPYNSAVLVFRDQQGKSLNYLL